MSSKNSNKINVPEARAAMDKFKMEAAAEVGVNLKEGYNGDQRPGAQRRHLLHRPGHAGAVELRQLRVGCHTARLAPFAVL